MVIREYGQCTVCQLKFILRVGIGLAARCTHTFDCPLCHTPITIDAVIGEPPHVSIEMCENAQSIEEGAEVTTVVNLHPSVAFTLDQFHSPYAFPSLMYMNMVGPFIRSPAGSRTHDGATQFEVPETQTIWPVVKSVLTLATKGDPANVLQKQIARYEELRKKYSPTFKCTTVFKCVASFFDDIFYPLVGALRNPLKVMIYDEAATHKDELERFGVFYRSDFEQVHLERYLAIFDDYFEHFDQFRQMLVYARTGNEDVDSLIVGAKSFNQIKLYYGQAYETLTSSYVILACLNNLSAGRKYDEFASMTLSKYINDVEKAKKANPFKDIPVLSAFTRFEDSAMRNGSHHASIWRDGELIKFRSGGTGAERDISYSRYMHLCNGITIALAALLLVEMQMFGRHRTT